MIKFSTKGRYALRIMIDLARNGQQAPVSLRSISERQLIPIKYMEAIAAVLLRCRLVVSIRGKEGGYRLSRAATEYSVYDILCAMEGDLAPVSCLTEGARECPLRKSCVTLPFWQGLEGVVRNYLQSVTLADLSTNELNVSLCEKN